MESEEPEGLPLVMAPGFGGGLVQYYKNLDHLHSNRKVYTFDLPGFGRSTRIPFSTDAEKVEEEFVAAIEKWRQEMGLEKFIFLGHSLGAFLACAYAIKYPSRVRHLILVDPWGFPIYADCQDTKKMPLWASLATSLLTVLNPLTPVRWAGPFGECFSDLPQGIHVPLPWTRSQVLPQGIHVPLPWTRSQVSTPAFVACILQVTKAGVSRRPGNEATCALKIMLTLEMSL